MIVSVVGAGKPSNERSSRLAFSSGAATEKRETASRRAPQETSRFVLARTLPESRFASAHYCDAGLGYAIGDNITKRVGVKPDTLCRRHFCQHIPCGGSKRSWVGGR